MVVLAQELVMTGSWIALSAVLLLEWIVSTPAVHIIPQLGIVSAHEPGGRSAGVTSSTSGG